MTHEYDKFQANGPGLDAAVGRERLGAWEAVTAHAGAMARVHSDRLHRVKSWPHLFEATLRGDKTHEMRKRTDRDYRVGDVLLLQEFDPTNQTYSGRELALTITYVTDAEFPCALSGDGLHEDFCILSIRAIV